MKYKILLFIFLATPVFAQVDQLIYNNGQTIKKVGDTVYQVTTPVITTVDTKALQRQIDALVVEKALLDTKILALQNKIKSLEAK